MAAVSVCFDSLVMGQRYGRDYLANLWGLTSYHTINQSVFIPKHQNVIVLFVTTSAQGSRSRYVDYIEDGKLCWDGEEDHGSDNKIINSSETGGEIHLFCRDASEPTFMYYGQVKLDIYVLHDSQPSRFIFSIGSKDRSRSNLLSCEHLNQSDKYFEALLDSHKCTILGDIELLEDELSHLSSLITSEMNASNFTNRESLSVALYLVGIGARDYEEGNYWGAVYKSLDLPSGQVKWQSIFGEVFLRTVAKYKLFAFKGEVRYLTPILAHCCVPDIYLPNYFKDVVLAIYKDSVGHREPIRSETERLVKIWRTSIDEQEMTRMKVADLESKEKALSIALDANQNRDELSRLQTLEAGVNDSPDLEEFLSLPGDWLEVKQQQKAELQKDYVEISEALHLEQEVVEAKERVTGNLDEIHKHLYRLGEQLFESVEDCFPESFQAIPSGQICGLLVQYQQELSFFRGPFAWLYRLLFRRRWNRVHELSLRIFDMLSPLKTREEFLLGSPLEASNLFEEMNQLMGQLKAANTVVKAVEAKEEKVFGDANQQQNLTDPHDLQQQLEDLSEEISSYRMKLVKLGRGSEDAGKDELAQQRDMRQEISALRDSIPGDIDAMLACLTGLGNIGNASKIKDSLVNVRKEIDEQRRSIKIFSNPLYSLNESSRVFIFQGKDKAIDFVYNSLLLLSRLHRKSETVLEPVLPTRISKAMKSWWSKEGEGLLEEALAERSWERGDKGKSLGGKPLISFHPLDREIRVVLPEQTVKDVAAEFHVIGESGAEQLINVGVIHAAEEYKTEKIETLLERPEPKYKFRFVCGQDDERIWEIAGPGWVRFSLLFSAQGIMIDNDQLPDTGAYIISPVDSTIEPASAVKEEGALFAEWAGFKYSYLDLEGVDVVLLRTDAGLDIFKKQPCVETGLYGGQELSGVTAPGGIPVYKKDIPSLIFSISSPRELQFYGVEIDGQSWPVERLGAVLASDNTVYLNLDALGAKSGIHEVTLKRSHRAVWHGKFASLPRLDYWFEKDCYPISYGNYETSYLRMQSETLLKLQADEPFECSSSEGIHQVMFPLDHEVVNVVATFHFDDKETNLALEFSVPTFRWRFLGARTWKTQIEEIWHEDLSKIQVFVPEGVSKTLQLILGEKIQSISSTVKGGVVDFNLRRFTDSIRGAKSPLVPLTVNLPERNIGFVIASIRTIWQAVRFKVDQKQLDGQNRVVIEWDEWGRASNRVIRLWPLNIDNAELLEYQIENGINKIEITEDDSRLLSGRYRLELAATELWEEQKPVLPRKGAENTFDVLIGIKEDALLQELKNGLKITGFGVDKKDYHVFLDYFIIDIRLTPEFEGELLFSGDIVVRKSLGKQFPLDCNPVSFYYEDGSLPFLVDKDGDGAMYCFRCQELFWEVSHCGNRHEKEPSIIYVALRRGNK